MAFTIDAPTRYLYLGTGDGPAAISTVEAETAAITSTVRAAVEGQIAVPEPSGYRITHVFQVVDDDGEPESLQYIESMDVSTWEHIGPAIETLLTRTRADGWTAAMTIAPLNLPAAPVDQQGTRAKPRE